MTTTASTGAQTSTRLDTSRRASTETKASFKTTEFIMYLAAVVGVLVASQIVGGDTASGDIFRSDRAWTLITALTIGYMISRGLAKSGSREFYQEDNR